MRRTACIIVALLSITALAACGEGVSPVVTPVPSDTPVPAPPTVTTPVPAPPTATTPVPPTATPVPTDTPAPPTATSVPATPTPTHTAAPARGLAYPPQKPAASSGQAIFAQNCTTCHGEKGRGDGPAAAGLDPRPANFTDADFMRQRSPAELFQVITQGRSPMPPWGEVLTEEQRWDVLFYEWSLSTTPQAIAAGQAIFEANCVACHGPQGQGDGPAAASLDPRPANFTDLAFMASKSPAELFQTVTNGRRPMPAWKDVLSEEKRWNVLDYIRTFSYGPTAGEVATAPTPTRVVGGLPSFARDIMPIFLANCVRCHSDDSILGSPPNGLKLTDYEAVMRGSSYLPVVVPGKPDNSPLILMTRAGTMPADSEPLPGEVIQRIAEWIAAGAPDN